MLEPSAIAMLLFGIIVLYGGLSYFIFRAMKHRSTQKNKSKNLSNNDK
ncbi:MAG: MetS family NSS transporter small subunit [Thermoplasmatota archaeon]